MFIQITDPGDNTRILLNAACILMVRCSRQGGSTIYLSTSALHHPDILLAQETPEQIMTKLGGAFEQDDAPDCASVPAPALQDTVSPGRRVSAP